MAKKKDKDKKAGRTDAVRAAVDQAFAATAGGAQLTRERAQEIADELAGAVGRLRDAFDDARPVTSDDLKGLRAEIAALGDRVARVEAAHAGEQAAAVTAARSATRARAGATRAAAARTQAAARKSPATPRKPAASGAKGASTTRPASEVADTAAKAASAGAAATRARDRQGPARASTERNKPDTTG